MITFSQTLHFTPVGLRTLLFVAGSIACGFIAAALYVAPAQLVLAGVVGLFVTGVIIRWPLAGVILIAATLPLERIGTYELSGYTIRISQVFLIMSTMSVGMRVFFNHKLTRRRLSISALLVAFLAANVLSLLASPNTSRSVTILLFTTFTMLLVWVIPRVITSESALRQVVYALLITGGIVSLFGMFQFFGDLIGLPTTVTGLRDLYTQDVLGFPRIQSTAYEPLYFANYLFIPLLIAFSILLSRSRARLVIPLALLLVVGASSFVLTVSRGAYLGMAGALIALSFFYARRVFSLRTLLLIPMVVVVVWWVVMQTLGYGGDIFRFEKYREQVLGVFTGASFSERVETIDTAIQAWRERPIFGIGPGGFGPYAATHPVVQPKDGWKIVNNEYLELLAEVGIVGLFILLLFIALVLMRSVVAIRRASSEFSRAVLIGLFAALVGIFIQYLTFSTLYIVHVWFLIGLLVAVQTMMLSRSEDTP